MEFVGEDDVTADQEEESLSVLKSGRTPKRSVEKGKSTAALKREKKGKRESKNSENTPASPVLALRSSSTEEPIDPLLVKLSPTDQSQTDSTLSPFPSKHGHSKKDKRRKSSRVVMDEDEEDAPLPMDPLELELEPIPSSFWKEDFSLTKGHEKMFDFDDAEEFGYEDVLLDNEQSSGIYLSSRGEKRQRRVWSQIVLDDIFKPDRGRSIMEDSRFDVTVVPSTNPSMAVTSAGGVENSSDAKTIGSPSMVTAVISEGTIFTRITPSKVGENKKSKGKKT